MLALMALGGLALFILSRTIIRLFVG
jgi:hypothetical protein